jgi:hypothetical protein
MMSSRLLREERGRRFAVGEAAMHPNVTSGSGDD